MKLKELAPNAKPKIYPPRVIPLEGGAVSVEAAYSGKHTLDLRWDRKAEGWKLISISWRPGG